MESTTIIAFDQHAATTVAAVLLPGQRTPALHPLTSDSPTILRGSWSASGARAPVGCCYEAGPCGFELQRALTAQGIPCDVIAPGPDSAAAGRSHQDGSARCGASSRSCTAPARSRRFTFPRSRKKPPAICCGVARTSAPISSARGIGCRSSCSVTAAASRRRRRPGRSGTTPGCARRRGRCRRSSRRIAPICARSTKRWRAADGRGGSARPARARAAAAARPTAALLPRHR